MFQLEFISSYHTGIYRCYGYIHTVRNKKTIKKKTKKKNRKHKHDTSTSTCLRFTTNTRTHYSRSLDTWHKSWQKKHTKKNEKNQKQNKNMRTIDTHMQNSRAHDTSKHNTRIHVQRAYIQHARAEQNNTTNCITSQHSTAQQHKIKCISQSQ